MRKTLKITWIIVFVLALVVVGIRTFSNEDDWICVNGEWVKHGNPSTPKPISFCEKSCTTDADCETPGYFLIQSNCPFSSTCLDNECVVVCPLFEQNCSLTSDCDCSWRGNKTLECLCLRNSCFSVEKK